MKAHIQVDPLISLLEQPVHIMVSNLPVNTHVTIRATTNNILGLTCSAHAWATYMSDSDGTLDLDNQRPLAGTYHSVDGMGLFWSMEMTDVRYVPTVRNAELQYEPRETVVRLSVEIDGEVVDTTDCMRLLYDPNVYMTNITEHGLVGKLFIKKGAQSAPGIIVLGGGEGGLASPMTYAALLASHGYPSLALAYFRFEDLPNSLREVPLEYFEKPIKWLKSHPACNGQVVVYGRSKGAELSLLLGSQYAEIAGVIASSPNSVVCIGDMEQRDNSGYKQYSSWSTAGRPVPFVPWSDDLCAEAERCLKSGERIDHVHRQAVLKTDVVDKYEIPVEQTRGPILLISSGDDHWWPATLHCERIKQRLKEHDFAYECVHVDYPNAGHVLRFPGVPTTQLRLNGGTPEENNAASTESWHAVLSFLDRLHSTNGKEA